MKSFYLFLSRMFVVYAFAYLALSASCYAIIWFFQKMGWDNGANVGLLFSFLGFIAITAGLSARYTGQLRDHLVKAAILDNPNERSMHTVPVPRGGGWAFIVPIVLALGFVTLSSGVPMDEFDCGDTVQSCFVINHALPAFIVLLGVIALTVISWLDDRGGIGARWRLLVQLVVTASTLLAYNAGQTGSFFTIPNNLPDWMPLALLIPAVVFLWTGFMNFYNFMDGIDGITAIETISLSLGLILLSMLQTFIPETRMFATEFHVFFLTQTILLVLLGCSIGFLRYNWHPAKIFLGDVGSIAIGYLLGFCLFSLAAAGYWAIALTLPLYYLADGGLTLLRRLLNGEKIWQAHRTHFYQRAAQAAGRHDVVVKKIALCNLVLTMIAALQLLYSPWFILLAPLPVALLLHKMGNWQCR